MSMLCHVLFQRGHSFLPGSLVGVPDKAGSSKQLLALIGERVVPTGTLQLHLVALTFYCKSKNQLVVSFFGYTS